MSVITRRSLFGIGAGAATAALVPVPAKPHVIVGIDFGKEGMAVFSQPIPQEWKTFYPSRTLKWWHDNLLRIKDDPEYARYREQGCDCYPWPGYCPYCGAES